MINNDSFNYIQFTQTVLFKGLKNTKILTNKGRVMKNMIKDSDLDLLDTFKLLLNDQRFGSQLQLSRALSLRGFENVTQTRISRLLKELGAIKFRNQNNDVAYRLPAKQHMPSVQQTIDSVVLSVSHNNMQIIIKTVIGGATLISKMIEAMGESSGILGCMASDNTIMVIINDVNDIDKIMVGIVNSLGVNAR